MLAKVGGSYYAVSNRCPHMNGDLSTGTLEGHGDYLSHGMARSLICAMAQNIRWLKGAGLLSAVGKALKSPKPLKTYKVKVEGDTISIEV